MARQGRPLRVVHLSTHDVVGGAARAANRLHAGLGAIGCASRMLVAHKSGHDPAVETVREDASLAGRLGGIVRRRSIVRELARYAATRRPGAGFSSDRSPLGAAPLGQLEEVDVINLHWVAGLCDARALLPAAARIAPLVWTLHDMNPFTGGCHYDDGCGRFVDCCGACPQLGSRAPRDLSHTIWRRRRTALDAIPRHRLRIVAPSRWLADEARRSSLFSSRDVSTIPYGVDTEVLAPRDRAAARRALGLPAEAAIVLFVATALSDHRKGYDLLCDAVGSLAGTPPVHLVSLGRAAPAGGRELGLNVTRLGFIDSEQMLAACYSAADLFVITSRQDNLPNTVLEAMACGTPVVGFAVGGIPDMVRSGSTGVLAAPGDGAALGRAIAELVAEPERRRAMGERCRQLAVAEYPLARQAERYRALYAELVAIGVDGKRRGHA